MQDSEAAGSTGGSQPTRRPTSFWVAILLACFLLGSLLANFVLFVGLMLAVGPGPRPAFVERRVMGDQMERSKIVMLHLSGMIADVEAPGPFGDAVISPREVREALRQAREDGDVCAILLSIDSPGGGVTASDLIRHEILDYKRTTREPVAVLMGDVAASGGYYVSTPADRIFAHPTTITGSIGVIFQLLNYRGLFEKVGLKEYTILSPDTPFKDIGSPSREMREDEKQLLQGIVQEMYERFVDVVVDGRQSLDREAVRKLADGSVMTAFVAKERQLVDEIGYLDEAVAYLRARMQQPSARVVAYERPPTLLDSLLARSRVGDGAQSVEGAMRFLRGGSSPRFLYLWTRAN